MELAFKEQSFPETKSWYIFVLVYPVFHISLNLVPQAYYRQIYLYIFTKTFLLKTVNLRKDFKAPIKEKSRVNLNMIHFYVF